MESVNVLKGTGKGKTALIIGSGMSTGEFDFSKVPEDVVRIVLNFIFLPIRIDFNLFTDSNYNHFLTRSGVDPDLKFIGMESNVKDSMIQRCNYSFKFGDVPAKTHSGFYALYIADQIMRFKKIYLIGYDYKLKNGYVHYYGDYYMSQEKKSLYTEKYFKLFLGDFHDTKWKADIFNLNSDSNLKVFRTTRRIK